MTTKIRILQYVVCLYICIVWYHISNKAKNILYTHNIYIYIQYLTEHFGVSLLSEIILMMGKFGSADHGDWGSIVSNSTGLVGNPSPRDKHEHKHDINVYQSIWESKATLEHWPWHPFPELLCTVKGLQDSWVGIICFKTPITLGFMHIYAVVTTV